MTLHSRERERGISVKLAMLLRRDILLPVTDAALYSNSLDVDDLDSRVTVQRIGFVFVVKNLDSTCGERHWVLRYKV